MSLVREVRGRWARARRRAVRGRAHVLRGAGVSLRHRAAPPAFAAALTDLARIDRTYPPPGLTAYHRSTWPPAPHTYYTTPNVFRKTVIFVICYLPIIMARRG